MLGRIDVAEMLIPMFMFPMIGYIVYITLTNARRLKMARMQAEMHGKLLDKFGTSQELVQYLESEVGRAFLEPPHIERVSPYRRILGSVQVGIILSVVGGVFLLMRNEPAVQGAVVVGGLLLALGLGFLISAAVSFRLSKAWGLLGPQQTDER